MDYVKELAKGGYVHEMEHASFKARLMKAERLEGEQVHGLPPGQPIPVFPIAALPGAPDSWVREAGAYVCPIDVGWGLWFDWTMNDAMNTTIVPSVKGMNPITGRKLEGLGLEQYADKCPVHDKPFSHGYFCEECNYSWPPQNYVCHPNTLWWDGFRQPDGTVRQFFFTDEDKRDIASAVIGKENTVPAFGFAFYKPKVSRTPPQRITRGFSGYGGQMVYTTSNSSDHQTYDSSTICLSGDQLSKGLIAPQSVNVFHVSQIEEKTSGKVNCNALRSSISGQSEAPTPKKSKDVSVGAGAQIRQDLSPDDLGLEGWQDKAGGVIRLYFCFEEQLKEIIEKGGVKDFMVASDKEGYLKGLPKG